MARFTVDEEEDLLSEVWFVFVFGRHVQDAIKKRLIKNVEATRLNDLNIRFGLPICLMWYRRDAFTEGRLHTCLRSAG